MKYQTINRSTGGRSRKERRSPVQLNIFPFEDLQGNIIPKERRTGIAEPIADAGDYRNRYLTS